MSKKVILIDTQTVKCNECDTYCRFLRVGGSCFQRVFEENKFVNHVYIYPEYEIKDNGEITVGIGTHDLQIRSKNRPVVKLDFNITGVGGIISERPEKRKIFGACSTNPNAPKSKLVCKALESMGK